MEIIIILLLILLNGLLSMTEMAFVSSRKYKNEADDRFLSTIQIGITLISILTGLFSGNALSED
ncbi:MAG: hemolysin, partial [Bacteroidales bacterium]